MQNHPTCMNQIGDNRYRCSRYGFVVETTVFPIRCACPDTRSVDAETMEFDLVAETKRRIWQWMERIDPTDEERAAIAERLERCLTECEHYTGGVCDDWPRECKQWEVWMQRLAFGGCRK